MHKKAYKLFRKLAGLLNQNDFALFSYYDQIKDLDNRNIAIQAVVVAGNIFKEIAADEIVHVDHITKSVSVTLTEEV